MTAGLDDCTLNPDVLYPSLLICSLPRIHCTCGAESGIQNSGSYGLHTWLCSPAVFLSWNWKLTLVLHNLNHLCRRKSLCHGLYLCGNPKSLNCMRALCQKQASGRRGPSLCWCCRRRSVQSPTASHCGTHSSFAPYHSPSHRHQFLRCFHHWRNVQAQIEASNQILTQAFSSWARLLQKKTTEKGV